MQKFVLFLAIVLFFGVGGYIGYDYFLKATTPVKPPEPPPRPETAEEKAAKAAATLYQQLTERMAKEGETPELFAKRGRAAFDAKGAIKMPLPKIAEGAVKDLFHAEMLGWSAPELYGDIVLATIWIEALHPTIVNDEGQLEPSAVRELWFAKTMELLNKACDRGAPAHRARAEFIDYRFRKPPLPADPAAWREKQIESYDALMKGDATAEEMEKAGDVAMELKKNSRATAFYLKAIELAPAAKERIQKKMSGK